MLIDWTIRALLKYREGAVVQNEKIPLAVRGANLGKHFPIVAGAVTHTAPVMSTGLFGEDALLVQRRNTFMAVRCRCLNLDGSFGQDASSWEAVDCFCIVPPHYETYDSTSVGRRPWLYRKVGLPFSQISSLSYPIPKVSSYFPTSSS